jgi:hypothetical protein
VRGLSPLHLNRHVYVWNEALHSSVQLRICGEPTRCLCATRETCTPDAWFERFTVSRFSDSDVDRILTMLKNEGIYVTQLGWKPIRDTEREKEDDALKALAPISQAIAQAAKSVAVDGHANDLHVFKSARHPAKMPSSTVRADNQWMPRSVAEETLISSWNSRTKKEIINSISCEEYKTSFSISNQRDVSLCLSCHEIDDLNPVQNERKIFWGLADLMFSDMSRLHVNGLTMEGSSTRIWNCNRSFICASKAFDCHQVCVHVLLMCLSPTTLTGAETSDPILSESVICSSLTTGLRFHCQGCRLGWQDASVLGIRH